MSRNTKAKKKGDPRKRPEHIPRPKDEWIAELTAQVEAGPFNNFPTKSFNSVKIRNDELQRELYRDVFILGKADDVEEYVQTLPRNGKAIAMGGIWRDRGAALFKEGKLDDAREAWKRSIRYSLSEPEGSPLPHPTAFIRAMEGTSLDQYNDLIACANNIAQSHIKEESHSEVVVYQYDELNVLYLKMMIRWENVFSKLGNTSAAYAAIHEAVNHRASVFRNSDFMKADILGLAAKYVDIRHPDPRNIEAIRLVSSDLQIRGAWKKLRVESTSTTPWTARIGPSTAVYNGSFYVFGGEHYNTSVLTDGWVFNLREMNGWRPVAGPPTGGPPIYHQPLIVHEGRGYLFQGQSNIRVFDFNTETWEELATKLRNGDPWRKFIPKNYLIAFAAHLYKDRIYVFGGREEWGEYGRNVMMSLDLKTLLWDVWSGTPDVKGDVTVPGPRAYACSWIADDKFYVSLGSAKRKDQGPNADYTYLDIWSFDLVSHKWTDEKFSGNGPCYRTQSAYTFNGAWGKAVVFGGYNARMLISDAEAGAMKMGTYFADTFAWCPRNKRWSQVITKGFPTYRSCAEMFTDPSTGKTYLFGGLMSTGYAPSQKPTQFKLFSDIWELVIDTPGSGFKESDFESADPRFSKLGPWVRCYHCGSVGRWLTCTGTCRQTPQAASFCGKECQKLAWPQHKTSCRKV
ncbi:hypothetical protein M407DRAFT_232827 [Tulasnella calospora MUT 4182]|uniref:MYND-type domain-containing protein n=2 Tax=Tulasnella calospora MUT 4182 TaxID=1051891 RepID=A0A0C3M167_9AGAM|nr:hypothetical protein M407DRAFT_232827 [Tulasnella calospora MUT 4182]